VKKFKFVDSLKEVKDTFNSQNIPIPDKTSFGEAKTFNHVISIDSIYNDKAAENIKLQKIDDSEEDYDCNEFFATYDKAKEEIDKY
jgi:hypothetical protein